MGNTLSAAPLEGQGHPELFYKGVAAAQQARFTVSELYFVQALRGHPGRGFWDALLQAVEKKAGSAVPLGTPESAAAARACVQRGEAEAPAELQSLRDGDGADAEEARANDDPLHDSAADVGPESADGSHAKSAPCGVVEVELPLSGRLTEIVDVYRLTADVALTYLRLLRTTRHRARVCALAARYCLLTLQHTQALLHCLTLWKEAHVRDGLGLVDYAKTRGLTLGSGDSGGGGAGTAEAAGAATGAAAAGTEAPRRGGAGCSHTASLLFTLALAEAHCRYYHLSFLVAYAMLLTDAAKATTDTRRQARVYANVVDHLDAAYELLHRVAAEYPEDYGGQLVAAQVPACVSGLVRDQNGSAAASSSASRQRAVSVGSDTYAQLYAAAAPWLPTHSALLPLAAVRHVRLCVPASLGGAARARLLSPAQRMSYHYCSWRTDTVFLAIPGCSPYRLARALPGFVPGKGTLSHQTEMFVGGAAAKVSCKDSRADTGDAVRGSADGVAGDEAAEQDAVITFEESSPVVAPAMDAARTAAERAAFMKKCKAALKKSGRNINTDLDLKDERTLAMLCQDEVTILSLQALLLAIEVHGLCGNSAAAAQHAAAILGLVRGSRGPDSAELHMLTFMLRSLGL